MIQPRSLRFLHCTVFIVDSYKQWSAFLHFRKARFFSGRHTEGFGTNEPGDSVLGADSRPGGTDRSGRGPATRPKLFGRGSSLCEDFPGLRRVRTSTRCSLGGANTDAKSKGTYKNEFSVSHFVFFRLGKRQRHHRGKSFDAEYEKQLELLSYSVLVNLEDFMYSLHLNSVARLPMQTGKEAVTLGTTVLLRKASWNVSERYLRKPCVERMHE